MLDAPPLHVFSAEGAFSSQPGASPQDSDRMVGPALKARFNGPRQVRMNCAFSAGSLALYESLGRCPRLSMSCAVGAKRTPVL